MSAVAPDYEMTPAGPDSAQDRRVRFDPDAAPEDGDEGKDTLPKSGVDMKVSITFEDLSYGVYEGKGKKNVKWLLKNVTGSIRPGKMTALMGPSGAGKSTLLDVLAGRKTEGVIEGDLLFNGRERTREMKRWFGYVEQKDILISTLTVKELLMFTARLRMPKNRAELGSKGDLEEKERRVDEVIRLLGLTGCKDVIIGDASNRGVSGGQAKRVNAAMELITRPSILFLDEPTSGLDSATSFDFMKVIKDVADTGVGIICTIHQPSSDIYALFDRLLLLVSGEVVYLGEADQAVDYFQAKGFPCAADLNPADYLVAVTAKHKPLIETPETRQWPTVPQEFWAEEYRKSAIAEMRKFSTKRIRADGEQQELGSEVKRYANSFGYNTAVLIARQARKAARDPGFFFKRVVTVLVTSLIFMTVYVNSGVDQQDVRNRQSLIMLTVTFFSIGANSLVAPFVEERLFVARELNAATYPVESYYCSVVLFELPYNLLKALIWSALLYYPCNFYDPVGNFFFFLLCTFFLVDIGVAMAQTFAYAFPTAEMATMMMSSLPLIFILFSGFFVQKPNIPDYWIWAYYISYCNYGVSALLFNEFYNDNRYCFTYTYQGQPFGPSDEITSFCNGTALDYSAMAINGTYQVSVPGNYILSNTFMLPLEGFQSSAWQNFGMLALTWVVFRTSAYLCIKLVKHGRAD
eukprot:comp23843_c0_seq1/m.41637 comp23843_c0_seq1/g.41637  ORF comp23843_c0_seq1/g.41637 comp23843_c0_seq1/m.41637 type:complete len:691 (-) comp23843_c0_seq1:229-2301(-)